MSLAADARVLLALLRGQSTDADLATRLAAFYGPQAAAYDGFRERLLQGRGELYGELAARLADGAQLAELGAGTGRNIEFLGERRARFAQITLVDLCAPLLAQARMRAAAWDNVELVEADATRWRPAAPLDAVCCAYSLTMIPDWFAAIDNALAMLAPGGLFGVVDFYVARRHPAPGLARHSVFARHFWPLWFAHDGVRPNADHLPYLQRRAETLYLHEDRARVPYLPGLRVPYYVWIGRRRTD